MAQRVLYIDTSIFDERVAELKRRLSSETFMKVMWYTISETGNKVKTLSKPEIQKDYNAKTRYIYRDFKRPIMNRSRGIDGLNCIIPVQGPRGTFARNGAYMPKRGKRIRGIRTNPRSMKTESFGTWAAPQAKIVTQKNSILPIKGNVRRHFYIPSGRLAGHIFAIKEGDTTAWMGVRRERARVVYRDSSGRLRAKRTGALIEQGMRKRKGKLVHGVGVGVPQMPENRSMRNIQNEIMFYACERLEHHAQRALNGQLK